ncbi:MAG: polysaccharide deacetylase family protein [Myxococcaceae bacterium]|nr:polysaccharide deacetylase family protein [Myxococcaceae bacterium]
MAAVRRFRSGGRRVLILSYHRVVEDFTGALQTSIPGLLISRETFRRQLEELAASGYEFASMADTLDVIAGRRRAKKDLCLITFDDGYRDVYRHGFPILRSLGIPAVMYVPSGYIGTQRRFQHDRLFHLFLTLQTRRFQPILEALPAASAALVDAVAHGRLRPAEAVDTFLAQHSGGLAQRLIDALSEQLGGGSDVVPQDGEPMTWDEVRELAANGFEIGAHTVSHTVLPMEEPERAEWEIVESKATIERELGRPCRDFAYCNGWYSDELIRMLIHAGFRSAVTTEDLPNRIGGDPFTLKRKVLWENFSAGFDGGYSSCVTGCQLDDVFTSLGGGTVVIGRKPQRGSPNVAIPFTEPESTLPGGI